MSNLKDFVIEDGVLKRYKGSDEEVVIPDGITEIGNYSYRYSTMGAFQNCTNLTSITIPDSVVSIGSCAFRFCTNLTSVTIPNSVTSIENWAFSGCTGLTSITIPDSVTSIGRDAFYGCTRLKSITIPDSVTCIESEAFEDCISLTNINIPDNIIYIGYNAFKNTACYNNIANWENGLFYLEDRLIDAEESLSGFYSIKTGTKFVSDWAFYRCNNITGVIIPDGVLNIGSYAFCQCESLQIITIPGSVTSIGAHAFEECKGLKSIDIPSGVLSIGDDAFWKCTNLKKITIPDSVISIGGRAFENTAYFNDKSNFDKGILHSKNVIIRADTSLSGNYHIDEGISCIAGYAFWECAGLTEITIPDSVTSIGDGAFDECSNLTSITIPYGITSISKEVFAHCGSITSINIPNSVTSIENGAFLDCASLEKITVPDSVTYIGEYVFDECKNLKSVTLGAGLKKLCQRTFSECSNLASICVDASNTTFDSRENCNAVIETEKNRMVIGCKSTTFPESVIEIGEYAFYACTGLTYITIPESVAKIGKEAFGYCYNLQNAVLPDNVKVAADAFKNVRKVTYNGSIKAAPWGAKKLSAPNPVPVKPKEKAKPSVSTPFEGKKIVFIGIDLAANPDIKKILKLLGCSVVTKVSKNVDFMVYTKEMVSYSSDYRSAEFQRYNNKKTLWTYEQFLAELKKYNIDVAAIEKAGIIYPVDTPDKKLASFEKAVNDSIYFFHNEEILKFNDDFYEPDGSSCSGNDAVEFDEDVLKILMKYDIFEIPRIGADIYDIIDMCGGNECLNKVIAMCVATRMFFDPEFECKFRIYRDKYEGRGEYCMAYGEFNIPPALYWEINRRHPFGFVSFVKQH